MTAARKRLAAAGLAVAALGGLALYGSGAKLGNLAGAAPGPCADSDETVKRAAPLARGEVAALDVSKAPRPAPELHFKAPDGSSTDLAALKGKALLVNLWATWCGPCKAEMPALDRLQKELGGKDFQVVAINVETRNLDKIPRWLEENWIDHLAAYTDPEGKVLPAVVQQVGMAGLPTTLVIDAKGCEIGVMKGPAEWASEDGKSLIRAVLNAGAS